MKKRIIFTSLILLVILCIPCFKFISKESIKQTNKGVLDGNITYLSTPTGIGLKENTYTIMKWDAVQNADHYIVALEEIYPSNPPKGQTTFEVTGTEVDIAPYIYAYYKGYTNDSVSFKATVWAARGTGDNMIKSDGGVWSDGQISDRYIIESAMREDLGDEYEGFYANEDLEEPEFITFNANGEASWLYDENAAFYIVELKINGYSKRYLAGISTSTNPIRGQISGNRFRADLSPLISKALKDFAKEDARDRYVSLQIKVQAAPRYYSIYNCSKFSSITYLASYDTERVLTRLTTPTNISMSEESEDLQVTYTYPAEAEQHIIDFYVDGVFVYEDNVRTTENGIGTYNIGAEYLYILSRSVIGEKEELSIQARVYVYAPNSSTYSASYYSAYSNTIKYAPNKPKLDTPDTITFTYDGTNYVASWSTITGAADYYVGYSIGDFPSEFPGTNLTFTTSNGVVSTNLTQSIESSMLMYNLYENPEENPEIMVRIRAIPANNDATYTLSDYSDYSNVVRYGMVEEQDAPVESISIGPEKVFIAQNREYQLDMDISPRGATYNYIDWTLSNDNAASLYEDGVAVGSLPGTTNVYATIDEIKSNTIEVTTYTIDSNIEDSDVEETVIENANRMIENISGTKTISSAAGTNLTTTSLLNTALNRIYSSSYKTTTNAFHVDMHVNKQNVSNYASTISTVKSKFGNNNTVIDIYDIGIDVNKTISGTNSNVFQITSLNQSIDIPIELPDTLPEVPDNKVRKISVINKHGTKYTKVPITVNGDTVIIKANEFSDFIVMYEDVELGFTQAKKTLKKGTEQSIANLLTVQDSFDTNSTYWYSSNESVATVEDGIISTHSKGTTTISVNIDGIEKSITIEVIEETVGDLSGNGSVDTSDILLTIKKLFGYDVASADDIKIADINGNEELDANDITAMLKYVFNYTDTL